MAWHKVTEDDINEYKKYMDDLIDNMHIDPNFSVCNDPLCDDSNHHICIEHLCEQLIDTCLETSAHALPKCAPLCGCHGGTTEEVTAVTFFPARSRSDQRGTNTGQIRKVPVDQIV